MPSAEIEEFGKRLIRWVRDRAIAGCDMNLRPDAKYPAAKRWKAAVAEGSSDAAIRTVVPDCVDVTIFYLLNAIDEGVLKLSFRAENGETVDLTRDGLSELAGWYAGEGWRQRHSKQRFHDDNADLADFFQRKNPE